jgi:hypothetical protein
VKLAASAADAYDGVAIDLTAGATLAAHSLTRENNSVFLNARSKAGIAALTVGVAGSGAVAVNATGFGNVITNSVTSTIKGASHVHAGGLADLTATDTSLVRSLAVSIAGSAVGVGALIGRT